MTKAQILVESIARAISIRNHQYYAETNSSEIGKQRADLARCFLQSQIVEMSVVEINDGLSHAALAFESAMLFFSLHDRTTTSHALDSTTCDR